MKVLIIGYGSIGKRHYENFKSLGVEVIVFSRRQIEGFTFFASLNDCLEILKPSHVVIANETSEHLSALDTVLKYSNAKILVEKPLYAFLPDAKPREDLTRVKVAYNLRFHPLIKSLKSNLQNKKVISWHAYVGQHLSGWRPGRDYKEVYSSSRVSGGGPLRDLSHEIDLFRFLTGEAMLIAAHGGHFSNIESDAEDVFSLLLKSSGCPHANIHMNCVDRIVQRYMTVITNDDTYFVDLITGRWRDCNKEDLLSYDRNTSYIEMAKSFLTDGYDLCTFEQAWETNLIIEKAEKLL